MKTRYFFNAEQKAKDLIAKKDAKILAFETSCDETAVSVVENGRNVLSNIVNSQIDIHMEFGGVVPEIASRLHVESIRNLTVLALEKAKTNLDDIDAIAVTANPGLIGCLIVGVSFAKAIAYTRNIPLIAVNHIDGHIAANYIAYPALEPPYVCLVASGGHSHIVKIDDYNKNEILGRAVDDAAGEAFDKTARALGLPYPGGPNLEILSKDGNDLAFDFSTKFNKAEHFDFSFSGMKTAVLNLINQSNQKSEEINKADIAASFQKSISDALTNKAIRACKENGIDKLALAGGVSANKVFRESLRVECGKKGLKFYCPPFELCTDNAAMIGSAAYYMLLNNEISDIDLNASAVRN